MFRDRDVSDSDEGYDVQFRGASTEARSEGHRQQQRREVRKSRAPKAFNGIHRRRGKKISW